MKVALTIAGFDPSGGAGIQADMRVFTLFGLYSTSVITAIAVQNSFGVKKSIPVDSGLVRFQIETILEDIRPDVLKVGMLQTLENVEVLADCIERYDLRLNVVDTVLRSKNGTPLLEEEGIDTFIKRVVPLCYVITPNIDEVFTLTGIEIKSMEDVGKSCVELWKMGAKYVIVKGGHFEEGELAVDTLYDGEEFYTAVSPRVKTKNTHGTGCTFASALASNLAKRKDVYTSFQIAKAYMYGGLSNQVEVFRGKGPINHLWLSGM